MRTALRLLSVLASSALAAACVPDLPEDLVDQANDDDGAPCSDGQVR